MTESDLQIQVADYLRLQYPDVLFHSDFGSGVKLTPGQAIRQKRQNGGKRAWPDLEIAETSCYCSIGWGNGRKKEGETLHPGPRAKNRFNSKDGKEYKNEHIMEQADCLYDLRQRGYCAEFAIGFDEAKKIIDEYLGGK